MKITQPIIVLLAIVNISLQLTLLKEASVGVVPIEINLCPDSIGDKIQFTGGTINQPPTKGVHMSLDLVIFFFIKTKKTGVALVDIALGNMRLTVLSEGVQIFQSDSADTDKFSSGDNFTYSFQYTPPGFMPSGTFTLQMDFQDATKEHVECGQFDVTF